MSDIESVLPDQHFGGLHASGEAFSVKVEVPHQFSLGRYLLDLLYERKTQNIRTASIELRKNHLSVRTGCQRWEFRHLGDEQAASASTHYGGTLSRANRQSTR